MAAPVVVHNNEQQEHGLTYDSEFLSSLPVLSPPVASPSSSASSSCSASPDSQPQHAFPSHLPPIRSISASQFADMHLRYVTTHAPDSVIFPFLHGLEGDNDAQNAFFFANGSMAAVNASTALGSDGVETIDREKLKARVPRFRGLVWVASDEDEVEEYERAMKARHRQAHSHHASSHVHDDLDDDISDDIEEDDYSTSSLDDEEEVEDDDFAGMQMDIDDHVDLNAGVVGMDVDLHGRDGVTDLMDHGEGAHMHPVVHAHRPALSAIDTSSKAHGHRLSNASSTSSFDSAASDEPSTSASPSPSPSVTSTSGSPCLPTPPTPPTSLPTTPATSQTIEKLYSHDVPTRVTLTSTFKPRELLCIDRETGETRFVEPKVPEGISLRNFGIQVPIFATLSDIVVYSPRGNTKAALAVASHFAHAVETKRRQRAARGQTDLLHYNVFVLQATPQDMVREMPHVVSRMADEVIGSGAHTAGTDALTVSETHPADLHPLTKRQQCTLRKANTINFAQREKDEMRELTQASEIVTVPLKDDEESKEFSASTPASKWDPTKGQVFLGNANDVPFPPANNISKKDRHLQEEWEWKSNDPALGYGYDVCIECDDSAPFPSSAHMRAAEEHIARLEKRWADHCMKEMERAEDGVDSAREIPVRPPPSAGLVVHLPFPSSIMYSGNSMLPFVTWLQGLLKPVEEPVTVGALRERKEREAEARKVVAVSNTRPQGRRSTNAATVGHAAGHSFGGPSSLPPPTAFPTSFFPTGGSSPVVPTTSTVNVFTRMRSTSATQLSAPSTPATPLAPIRTRPLKVLIYSADGYTESSSLALCLLMSFRQFSLPEAYLELQVEKRRSFFVYQNEIGVLKRIESRLERERMAQAGLLTKHSRTSANSVSFGPSSIPNSFLSTIGPATHPGILGGEALSSSAPHSTGELFKRPRASTLPPMPSMVSDHQMWFDDPRFDGSFPSRVLPFLYLGNLNHAANAYMLHALGITHVVSVGECALIPPENHGNHHATTAKPGSLWIEEKEGRIKVLDIKDVCDDGIDSLEPQLPPICEWIDEARRSGGKVLVHCRVGVSRSATVTIAYVMKYLNIPLVDAYLIVRSRRLSVLIQPNMRLLYNLIGWEVKLAQERAAGNKERLGEELARCLNWPYLAKEVHALNEKYLH